MRSVFLFILLPILSLLPVSAHASSIFLAGDSNIFEDSVTADNERFFQNVFNGKTVVNYSSRSLAGLSTTAVETFRGAAQNITSADLAGNDFMIFGWTRGGVAASELSAIQGFFNGGGSVFLFGEGATFFNPLNTAVNSILSALGSSMSLSLDRDDNLDFIAPTEFDVTGATSFAAGVDIWRTSFTAGINLGDGTAVVSGTADAGVFGTAVALETLAPSPIPLPAALPMFASALAAFGLWRKRATA